jgi:hypothetical protein
MSLGAGIGAVVGGVVGFMVGGPTGAWYGASIGFGIGLMVDPIQPDLPNISPKVENITMTSTIGDPLPDVLGTTQIAGHLLAYGLERVEAIEQEVGGKGGDSETQIIGYNYYMTWAVGICQGPVDILYAVYSNETVVWSGELVCPVEGGEETIELEGLGNCIFYFGTQDQIPNDKMAELIGDETLNSPYRGFCWALMDDCYLGNFHRAPSLSFITNKSPAFDFNSQNIIDMYNYNPIHMIYHIMYNILKLPDNWINDESATIAADTLASEGKGISVIFDKHNSALAYIQTLNSHIDGILRYGSDETFHPVLIRQDYDVEDLETIDENVLLDTPSFKRKSWIDTINEMKVQYTELIFPLDFSPGRWVAAVSQKNTPFVYVYDLTLRAVVKLDVSKTQPTVVEKLEINDDSSYILNYNKGFGYTNNKGGYCLSKSNDKIWYAFVNGTNLKVVEVSITEEMEILNSAIFTNVTSSNFHILDSCSNSDYAFFVVYNVNGKILKIDSETFTLEVKDLGYSDDSRGIQSIELNDTAKQIQWVHEYNYNAFTCHFYVTDFDFEAVSNFRWRNRSVNAPWWLGYIRYDEDSDVLLWQKNYYPSTGNTYIQKGWIISSVSPLETHIEYLQNVLGITENAIYTLNHSNAVTPNWYLKKTYGNFVTSVSTITINMNKYCKGNWHIWNEEISNFNQNYSPTAIGTYNDLTRKIVLFRYYPSASGSTEFPYTNGEVGNYVAVYNPDFEIQYDGPVETRDQVALCFRQSISDPNALDIGNKEIQRKLVSKTIKLAMFTMNKDAVWAARKQLQKESYPFASVSFPVNRNLFKSQVGDCVKFSYEKYGISNMIVRILSILEEKPDSEKLQIEGIEDIYSVSSSITSYTDPIKHTIEPPDYTIYAPSKGKIVEAPWFSDNENTGIILIPLAAKTNSLDLGFLVYLSIDEGNSYDRLGTTYNFSPYGTLTDTYPTTASIDENGFNVDMVSGTIPDSITWQNALKGEKNGVSIGNEFLTVQNIIPVEDFVYSCEDVIRSRFGTVQEIHSTGSDVFFISINSSVMKSTSFVVGATLYFKFVPFNIKEVGNIANMPEIIYTIQGTKYEPYSPINFCGNGRSFAARYTDDIVLTWSARKRGEGAGIGTAGIVQPTTGHEGLFEIKVYNGETLVRTITAIDAVTYTYTQAMNEADNPSYMSDLKFELVNYISVKGLRYDSDIVTLEVDRIRVALSGTNVIAGIPIISTGSLTTYYPVEIVESVNIASGAVTSTTKQLTKPIIKYETDFVSGLITDNVNPINELTVDSEDFTELEYSIILHENLQSGDIIEFRITNEGQEYYYYTLVPKITLTDEISS